MLYKETVEPGTLDLIKRLQSDPFLKEFYLVDGTALALQIGHRKSVDIDLFTKAEFYFETLIEHLEENYNFLLQYSYKNTLKGIINGVFVDLLRHNYLFVRDPMEAEGVYMLDKSDIAAMKVNAIVGNGTRIKDFIDIYFLLKDYSFKEIVSFYSIKYNKRSDFHALKSLTYFNDIEEAEWPKMVLEPELNLDKITSLFSQERDKYLKQK